MIRAVLDGGPFDGCEMGLAGKVPEYLLCIEPPAGMTMRPVVVGADFDDHWPGQQRYVMHDERLEEVAGALVPTVVFRHTPWSTPA